MSDNLEIQLQECNSQLAKIKEVLDHVRRSL